MRSLSILVVAVCVLALVPDARAQGKSSPAKVKKPEQPPPDAQGKKKVIPMWAFEDPGKAAEANKGLEEKDAKKPPGGIKELKVGVTLVAAEGLTGEAVKISWKQAGSTMTHAWVPKKALEAGSGELYLVYDDNFEASLWPTYVKVVAPSSDKTYVGGPVVYEGEERGNMRLLKPDPAGNGQKSSSGQGQNGSGAGQDGSGTGQNGSGGSGNGTGQPQQQQQQNQQQKSPLEQLAQGLGSMLNPQGQGDQEQPAQDPVVPAPTATSDLGNGADVTAEPTDDGRLRGLSAAEKKPVEASSTVSEPAAAPAGEDLNAAVQPGADAALPAGGTAANDPARLGGGSNEPIRARGRNDEELEGGDPAAEELDEGGTHADGQGPPGQRELEGLEAAFDGHDLSGLDGSGELSSQVQGFVNPGARSLSKRGYIQLDAGGAGYRSVGVGSRRWGSPAMVYGLMRAASRWSEGGPRLSIGDMSLEEGGAIWERDLEGKRVMAHKGHQDGLDVDVRALRHDGREEKVAIHEPAYDRDLTQQAIDLLRQELRVEAVYFDDRAIQGTVPSPSHSDHFHLRVRR